MIDTGSAWFWAYSEYAINKPPNTIGIKAKPVKLGTHKEGLNYGMGSI